MKMKVQCPPARMTVTTLSGARNSKQCLKKSWFYFIMVCIVILYAVSGIASDQEAGLWKALGKGSYVVLLRHAVAPGTGDPDHFDLADCSTQRNLSDVGREQAAAIGELFRLHGIDKARVVSSQWCRCQETARLLQLGPVEELVHLNSFFQQWERRDYQTRNLREWISKQDLDQPVVLVTHQVNITSLTDIYPSSGELVFVHKSKSGALSVMGTIRTD